MAKRYNRNDYFIDFTQREELEQEDVQRLMEIQETYRPVDRVEYLLRFRAEEKISDDDLEKLTGIPYQY